MDYAKKLDALHQARQGFKNQVLKSKLAQQNLLDSANLYIKPILSEQEKTIAAIEGLKVAVSDRASKGAPPIEGSQEKRRSFEEQYKIDFRGIDQNLPKSIRPVFQQDGFKIGHEMIEVNPQTRQMRVQGRKQIYDITQDLVDLIKGEPLEDYSLKNLTEYKSLLQDIGASQRSKRVKNLIRTIREKQRAGYTTFEDAESSFEGNGLISFLSDDTAKLKEQLHKLLSAAKEGHSNVYNEGLAILKRLLEKGEINTGKFSKLAKYFAG